MFYVFSDVVANLEGEVEPSVVGLYGPRTQHPQRAEFVNTGQSGEAYSDAQVDQGLWAIFATFQYHEVLFDIAVDLDMRIGCIESMFYASF